MRKILVVGCSYTAGWKLPDEKKNPRLWVNQLFPYDEVHNLSRHGANNHWIFLTTASAMRRTKFDQVIVAWSVIPRYHFRAGLETYCTDTKLDGKYDINLVGGEVISRHWLQETGDRLRMIHNDHWDILDLVQYVNILKSLWNKPNGLHFVNAMGPWCRDYFTRQNAAVPSDFDPYIQYLLRCDTRTDQETFDIYNRMHSEYDEHGGINADLWLNLYDSFDSLKTDTIAHNDAHPGLASQDVFTNFLRQNLT